MNLPLSYETPQPRRTPLPKVSVSVEESSAATALQPIEKDWYVGHVNGTRIDYTKKTGAPMVLVQVMVDEGEYRGRILPAGPNSYHYIIAGGKKEDGSLHNLGRFYDTINALGAQWECKSCGKSSTAKFVREKGHYFTPCCGKNPAIEIDTDTWTGLRARWQVDVEKINDSDDMRNVIKSVRPTD